jgi:AcrR family transcriptional regulator
MAANGLDVMRRCGTESRPRVADIVAAAGLSNDAFYRHFPSKDDLIVAALTKVDEQAREQMRAFVEAASDDPRERILATFDQLAIWLKDVEFKGCPFVAAAAPVRGRPWWSSP